MKRIVIMALALISFVPHTAAFAIDLRTNTASSKTNPVGATPADVGTEARASMASYNGRTIDLRTGWGTANACVVGESGTACFDTEAEMDAYIDETTPKDTFALRAGRAVCASSLRLYDFNSYGAPVLAFTQRAVYTNMSTVGFNNRTSSYKVGACSVIMWDGAGGTGPVYTGPMWAGVQAAAMNPFWDNRISSIYVN